MNEGGRHAFRRPGRKPRKARGLVAREGPAAPVALKIDEDLPHEVAELARRAGHDARSVADQGLGGATDDRLWRVAQAEGRCLWTAGKGFADARRLPPGSHAGVVLFRLPRESRGGYVHLVEAFLMNPRMDEARRGIVVVSPEAIRVHRTR